MLSLTWDNAEPLAVLPLHFTNLIRRAQPQVQLWSDLCLKHHVLLPGAFAKLLHLKGKCICTLAPFRFRNCPPLAANEICKCSRQLNKAWALRWHWEEKKTRGKNKNNVSSTSFLDT